MINVQIIALFKDGKESLLDKTLEVPFSQEILDLEFEEGILFRIDKDTSIRRIKDAMEYCGFDTEDLYCYGYDFPNFINIDHTLKFK